MGAETMNLALALVKVALSLAVVVGLLVLAVRLARRLGLGHGGSLAGQGNIRVIESRMIAPKRYVTVVAVGSELLALGVSDQSVNLLCRLDTLSGSGPGEGEADPAASAGHGFRFVLAAARGKGRHAVPNGERDAGPGHGTR